MKLTNYIREAFIKSAMNDVPTVDYDDMARKVVLDWAVSKLPTAVRKVWDNKETRPYMDTQRVVATPHPLQYVRGAPTKINYYDTPAEIEHLLEDLATKARAQNETLRQLRAKLKAVAYGSTTRKALVEKLPEFEKYLPAETPKVVGQLPAVTDVVTDFMKAGWPKGKSEEAAT